jgi:hypothetical protein
VRETSAEAYHSLEESGVLSVGRWEVYQDVFHNGPTTSGESLNRLNTKTSIPSQKRARFTELRAMGLLKEIGVRACAVTGFRAIEWDVTERADPLPLPKKKSAKACLKEAEARIEALESLLEAKEVACSGCAALGRFKPIPRDVMTRLLNAEDELKSMNCRDCGIQLRNP